MTDHTINPYCAALEEYRALPSHELKRVGDQWRSPDRLWWGINSLYGPFVLDLFADRENAKCEAYYTAQDNALTQNWSERLAELKGAAFANPPYSRASQHDGQYITGMRHIMEHTKAMREAGGRYVYLIKAATGEVWWPEYADHVAFIRGRISFDLPVWYRPAPGEPTESSAGFGAAIAVFDKSWRGQKFDYVSRDELEARGAAFMRQIEIAAAKLQPQRQQQNIPKIIPVADQVEAPQQLIDWLNQQELPSKEYRVEVLERLTRVANQFEQECGIGLTQFLSIAETIDRQYWLNIRVLRTAIRQKITHIEKELQHG